MEALQRSTAPSDIGRPARSFVPDAPGPAGRKDLVLSEIKAFLARARPRCTVYVLPHSEHVLQIYAGLYALHESGRIALRQTFDPAELRRRFAGTAVDCRIFDQHLHGLLVDVEGAGLVFFDVRDGGEYRQPILDAVAVYAKRSFHRGAPGPNAGKAIPLGVNYSIYHDRATVPELVKSFRQLGRSRRTVQRFAHSLARVVPSLGRALHLMTVGSLAAPLERRLPARAIFLARTWNPDEVPKLPRQTVEELNDVRAACIRLLRHRFGERFFGGLARSAHALERYPDCVVDANVSTRRRDYLQRLRAHAICVATTGLSDSTGWKFAEYLALGKAIVCEPMKFELPGPIAAGRNFLEFATPEDCAAQVGGLLEDRDAREGMMANNAAYFVEYGAPEAVVARTLHAALQRT